MSDNPYERLSKAVDAAIAEDNAHFLAMLDDPAEAARQEAAAAENAERWQSIWAAEQAAGRHGVVVPLATAEYLLAVLEGRDPESPWSTDLMVASLRDRIAQTKARGQ